MHLEGVVAVRELGADLGGPPVDGPRRLHGGSRVLALVEDDHEAVARRLVHVAAVLDDLVEEGAEIALDEGVEGVGSEPAGQPRVAADVREEHGDFGLALVERRRFRRFLDQVAHPLGHELGQARANEKASLQLPRVVEHLLMRFRVGHGHGGLVRERLEELQVLGGIGGLGALRPQHEHAADGFLEAQGHQHLCAEGVVGQEGGAFEGGKARIGGHLVARQGARRRLEQGLEGRTGRAHVEACAPHVHGGLDGRAQPTGDLPQVEQARHRAREGADGAGVVVALAEERAVHQPSQPLTQGIEGEGDREHERSREPCRLREACLSQEEIGARDEERVEQGGSHDDRIVARVDRADVLAPRSRDAEDVLDEERADDEAGRRRTDDRHDGDERVAERMPDDHRALPQALRARGPDEVLADRLEHARAGDPGEVCGGRQRQDERRQDHLAQVARRDRAAAVAPSDKGEPVQAHAEQVDEEDPNDKGRNRRSDRRDAHAQVVDRRVLLERAEDTQRKRDQEADEHRLQAELRASRQAVADDLDDRAVPDDADPKVELGRVRHVDRELLVDRPVEAVDVIEASLVLRAQGLVRVLVKR